MTTPSRIVINAQTRREDERRIVYRAHLEAQRQRRWQTVRRWAWRGGRVAWRVIILSVAVLAVVAAFVLGVALFSGG